MVRAARFRGENFRGTWTLGAWAEKHIIKAINETDEFRAAPYGKSEVGPTEAAEKQSYWSDHLKRESHGKRPDILVFERTIYEGFQRRDKGALICELPSRDEDDIQEVVERSLLGIESEASVWQGEKMPHYGRDWAKKVGRRTPICQLKNWTAPTVIVKEEDLQPLINWQEFYHKPVYIVHLFYDLAFMLSFEKLRHYIAEGVVCKKDHDYGKAIKPIYQTYYGLATVFGEFTELAEVVPFVSQTKGGKFEAALYFDGGKLKLAQSTIDEWSSLKSRQ